MTDAYEFWRRQLAGEEPDVTVGQPQCGYFTRKSYVSLPFSVPKKGKIGGVRVLTEQPVAIWIPADEICAVISTPMGYRYLWGDRVDDLFASCCRSAISHETYLEMCDAINAWRSGAKADEPAYTD